VWAGDQLLWELRVPGGDNVTSGTSGLDATNASGAMYGRVSYFHAGGIDKPLLITKEGVESVVPRDTWRGQFHAGTSPTTGLVRDCPVGVQTGCLLIAWPGWNTTASHSWGAEGPDIDVWYGGLVDGMRDASGQMHMRNRYYDPATGQFTQTDPIGLAGGLNAYGFADGDPVSYSDPYGLFGCDRKDQSDCSKSELVILGVAARLQPVKPALDVAFQIIMVASPDPFGEGKMVWKAFENVDDAARWLTQSGRAENFVSRFNPFRGKSAQEIDDMFMRKGFERRGPNPVGGRGGYVNPRNGHSYHIDEANSFNEPPHVDVNRLRGYKGPLEKRKLPM
jgi:RHS repeat-associated protein